MHILMLAAENGSLPGGKVGGMGDVIRDIPRAIAAIGHRVSVITPGYDRFPHLPGARHHAAVQARFRGAMAKLDLFQLAAAAPQLDVSQWVLEHPTFSACGPGRIYCDDPPERPFATDASKFALFCAGTARALVDGLLERPDVIHLHDWHSALLAVLIRYEPAYRSLADIPLVYTIHNLALQGIRPLNGDASALHSWFPELAIAQSALRDPRYPDCFNPMRAAINLCGKIHAVSPTYAREICDPASESGAGLQADLQLAHNGERLEGILNGCEYPEAVPPPMDFLDFLAAAREEVTHWVGTSKAVAGADLVALRTLDHWIDEERAPPEVLVTSVGRLTEQKLGLLTEHLSDGRSCLEQLLEALAEDGLLVILGNGSPLLETLVCEAATRSPNLLFLRGFSETLADQLYAAGDLFLMPSTFEPCGISQMLAMRSGQPCLVNEVGGLADTVQDNVTGFVFRGESAADRARALVSRFQDAMTQLRNHPRKTKAMRRAAAAARFHWQDAANAYVERLYSTGPPRKRRA